jgi:hypothetical protein
MEINTYIKASLINLGFLVAGLMIGLILVPRIETIVHAAPQAAKDASVPQVPASSNPPVSPPSPTAGPKVTQVQPGMTTGTIGIYLILSHHLQTDELVVNGYDLLKLQNAELGLLSHFVPQAEIKAAVESAKASEIFQVAQPTPPVNSPK